MSFCNWGDSEIKKQYHDEIWGRPNHDDNKHFENIIYEVLQCGLSWWLVYYSKQEILRSCFDNFDVEKVSEYTDNDVYRILNTKGMIKSESKIKAIINNAKCFINIQKKYGSFDKYLWSYTNGKTIIYDKHELGYIPSSNGLSERISIDLKNFGFKYLGPIVIYSHLQACGIILDHDPDCPCYKEILSQTTVVRKRRYLEKGVVLYNKTPVDSI